MAEWEKIIPKGEEGESVKKWLSEGVKVTDFFRPFKGNFGGKYYDSIVPPSICINNSSICIEFDSFISHTLLERVRNGSMSVWGKVGECSAPYLVLPLTIERSKPRLCHDARFLNLWIRDMPFTLETLKDVPRLVNKGDYMCTCDEKSGYDHINLHSDSRSYFGILWKDWYLVFKNHNTNI